jgi:hypothetical protein
LTSSQVVIFYLSILYEEMAARHRNKRIGAREYLAGIQP